MKKLLFTVAVSLLLAGCASTTPMTQHTNDTGQLFVGDLPVIARGELLRIEVQGSDGAIYNAAGSAASAVQDIVGDAGISASLVDMGAMSGGGTGLVVGIVAGIVGGVIADMAPPPPMIFVENADGVELQFPATYKFVSKKLSERCVAEGDQVLIIQVDKDRFEVFSADPDWSFKTPDERGCTTKPLAA